MKSNRPQSIFVHAKLWLKKLLGLSLIDAFKTAMAESRLKRILLRQHPAKRLTRDKQEKVSCATVEPAVSPEALKALRWKAYQDKGGQWDYETWHSRYDNNMKRALQTNISVNQYCQEIGKGLRGATIEMNGKEERLSITDVDALWSVEVRSGKYCSKSKDVMNKIAKHEGLVKKGWNITWKIEGIASLPLLKELKKAGININY